MAETPSTPAGAVPPKKETGKVQPKKETVRINLPPKPSAAPTIKLPTLPPGGPTGAASAAPLPTATKSAPIAAPAMQPRGTTGAPIAQQRPAPTAQRPAPAAAPTVGGLDKGLAIFAAIAGVAALAVTAYLVWLLPIGN
ncbi:MAG: hypothetical protein ABSD57_10915 [Verrucomicrobiota bacterium]|jgi:hypothetical protein